MKTNFSESLEIAKVIHPKASTPSKHGATFIFQKSLLVKSILIF